MDTDDEEFCPNWIILDESVAMTRLAIPDLDGADGPGQVPAVFQRMTISGPQPVRNKVFVVNPATWAKMPEHVLATLEPYEIKGYEHPGQTVQFRSGE